MQVLVTGAGGFTGRHMVDALGAAGHRVISFEADLTDPAQVENEVHRSDADAIIHLAGMAFVNSADFAPFYEVNQLGTFHLLQSAAHHLEGATVLLPSSANIYGNRLSGQLNESTVPNPVNHYAVSKYSMELGAQLWKEKLKIVTTRPFNYTGVGQEERFLIPKIVGHFRARKPRIELGNIDILRDFGDVRSVVDAYVRLIEASPCSETFNICTGRGRTIREIIDVAARKTGHDIEIDINPDLVRSNEIKFLVGDNEKLRACLPEWQPIEIEQTIEWMLEA